jgi:hypothetical protein
LEPSEIREPGLVRRLAIDLGRRARHLLEATARPDDPDKLF